MRNRKLLPAVVAILVAITSMSFVAVTSATHKEPSITISPTKVKDGALIPFTMTITNTEGDPLTLVEIIPDPLFTELAPMLLLPKDNIVELNVDNEVILKEGTVLTKLKDGPVKVAENTAVIRKENTEVFQENVHEAFRLVRLLSDVKVAVRKDTTVAILSGENLGLAYSKVENLKDNRVRLTEDTKVIGEDDNIAKLVEDTDVAVIADENVELDIGDNLVLLRDIVENLADNEAVVLERVEVWYVNAGMSGELIPGTKIQFVNDNEVVLPSGTRVQLMENENLGIPENTVVTRASGTTLFYDAIPVTKLPKGWTFGSAWTADNADYWLKAGSSLEFPFVLRSPTEGGIYDFFVRTMDSKGYTRYSGPFKVEVDNIPPSVTISVSKDPATHENIDITIVGSEVLSGIENVLVWENNAPENVVVELTTEDNIVWTGTYETSDNTERDGTAWIYVLGIVDEVGKENERAVQTFTIDRLPPPQLSAAYGLGALRKLTNEESRYLEGWAYDNFLGVVDNLAGLTVRIRVNDKVTEITSGKDGRFRTTVTLEEGLNEVGVSVVDKAGNEGPENVQEIFLDSRGPEISFVKIAGKAFTENVPINDPTPTFELTIVDPGYAEDKGLGIENQPYSNLAGYSVQIWFWDNAENAENLVNALAWDRGKEGKFENTWPIPLPEGRHTLFVIAGDNLNAENAKMSFWVDVTKPLPPNVPAVENPLHGTSSINPRVLREAGITVTGTAEPGSTVKVYVNDEVQTSVTAGADGRFTVNIALTPGVVNKVDLTATDAAGNESDKFTLGFATTDTTKPTVSIDALPETTDKPSITISGSASDDITKDEDLIVEVDAPGLAAPKRVRVEAGKWTTTVPLLEGPNTITVTVVDQAGNTASATATVERTVPAWGLYAIILVIIALILAAIAIFRRR